MKMLVDACEGVWKTKTWPHEWTNSLEKERQPSFVTAKIRNNQSDRT